MSVNKVILVGNLGRDPELRTFPNGGQVANATLATTRRWKDKQTGERREETEWHRLVFNGRLAEIAGQYLRKGSQVYIEGSIRTRKWQGQDGQDRYTTEIRVDQMQMLGSKGDRSDPTPASAPVPASGPNSYAQAKAGVARLQESFDDMEDDIPF